MSQIMSGFRKEKEKADVSSKKCLGSLCPQENLNIPHEHQVPNMSAVKAEAIKEDAGDLQKCTQEMTVTTISDLPSNKWLGSGITLEHKHRNMATIKVECVDKEKMGHRQYKREVMPEEMDASGTWYPCPKKAQRMRKPIKSEILRFGKVERRLEVTEDDLSTGPEHLCKEEKPLGQSYSIVTFQASNYGYHDNQSKLCITKTKNLSQTVRRLQQNKKPELDYNLHRNIPVFIESRAVVVVGFTLLLQAAPVSLPCRGIGTSWPICTPAWGNVSPIAGDLPELSGFLFLMHAVEARPGMEHTHFRVRLPVASWPMNGVQSTLNLLMPAQDPEGEEGKLNGAGGRVYSYINLPEDTSKETSLPPKTLQRRFLDVPSVIRSFSLPGRRSYVRNVWIKVVRAEHPSLLDKIRTFVMQEVQSSLAAFTPPPTSPGPSPPKKRKRIPTALMVQFQKNGRNLPY
ncbi:unnamed protein product [Ranitomeya imitator]|uniref:Uncharacterized protein n=1 Tax=Ranitomeya imitator TaxID=111125 RepID=A0ABN9MI51_9NEOB|nr:unnamed protein product [Ranitomeya imitator]